MRTDVSDERIESIIRVKRFGKIVTANAVPSSLILFTLMMEEIISSYTSVLT
jgi:hypothetical protein